MKRGTSERETCEINGWGVGTVVRGREMWSDGAGVWTTWRITGLGEETVLARTIRSEYFGPKTKPDDNRVSHEHSVTFGHRDWVEVPADAALAAVGDLLGVEVGR